MVDPKSLLSNSNGLIGKLISGMATKNFAAGLLTGGVAGNLIGRKGVGDIVEGAAKIGGLALLGTLAYKAYNNYQQTKAVGGNASAVDSVKQSASGMIGQAGSLLKNLGIPQVDSMVDKVQNAIQPNNIEQNNTSNGSLNQDNEFAYAIIKTMIAAAKADGKMDSKETKKILDQISSFGISEDEKSLIITEFANQQDISDIAKASKTPEQAAQIYLAGLIVCDSQCASEQKFLAELATALKLESDFTANLQAELLAAGDKQAA